MLDTCQAHRPPQGSADVVAEVFICGGRRVSGLWHSDGLQDLRLESGLGFLAAVLLVFGSNLLCQA